MLFFALSVESYPKYCCWCPWLTTWFLIKSISTQAMSACYPGSFISSILLVVAVYIHRNYAGLEVIDILNTLGFSDDYKEVQRLNMVFLTKSDPDYLGWSAEIRTIVQNMQQKVKQANCESVTSAMSISPGSSYLQNSLAIESFICFV